MLLGEINPWEMNPTYDLLQNWPRNNAYTLADPGQIYAVYFTNGGQVKLDLRNHSGNYKVQWLGKMEGKWSGEKEVEATGFEDLEAPGDGPWVVVLKRIDL